MTSCATSNRSQCSARSRACSSPRLAKASKPWPSWWPPPKRDPANSILPRPGSAPPRTFAGERFRLAAGLEVQHIPYRGPVQALADLMTGQIDFYFLPIAPALPLIKQGQVIALAVSTPKRAQLLPEVPTIAEAGYPSAEYVFWGGVSAPAGISPTIVAALNREINTALATPVIQEKLQQLGVEAMPMTPEHFGKFFADDVAAMAQFAKDANIAPMD